MLEFPSKTQISKAYTVLRSLSIFFKTLRIFLICLCWRILSFRDGKITSEILIYDFAPGLESRVKYRKLQIIKTSSKQNEDRLGRRNALKKSTVGIQQVGIVYERLKLMYFEILLSQKSKCGGKSLYILQKGRA